jgi:type II secretory pathway pseudopilin PulG
MRCHSKSGDCGESGFILLAVIFMVALILIAMAVAAPRIAKSIQRDKEEELIHRGLQYRQAIKLYYKKFGSYPASIDQLVNSNDIRFLRKRYTDPMTGKDDWKIIHFGQAHVKAMGLFGQPIANSGSAGSNVVGGGMGQGIGFGGIQPAGGLQSSTGAFGNSGALSSNSGNSSTDNSSSNSDSNNSSPTSGSTGTSGPPTSSTGFGSSSGFGNTNQTFGGAPIVGVASKVEKPSIKEYKQQKHYNEWEFVYDPLEDMQGADFFGNATNASGINGTGSSGTSTPFSSSPSPTGPTSNPTSPTSPQQ